MFIVRQRIIFIFNNNTAMNVYSNNDDENVHAKIFVNNNTSVRTHAKVKVNKPDIFDEDRRKLKAWLIQIKLYFKFNRVADDEKISFATTYFRGRAEHWSQFMLKDYLNEGEQTTTLFFSFFTFEKELKQIFDVFNEEQTVEQII